MKKIKQSFIISLLFICFYSCTKNEVAYTTFTGEMIYSHLNKDTTYSEFVKIINKTGYSGMLNAYGSYTCLPPTNTAIRYYYSKFGKHFNFDSLSQGQADTIARSHILINKFLTSDLSDGILPNMNMNQRVIEVKFSNNPETSRLMILLNDSSQIIQKDIEVYNGVLHAIDHVITPSNALLADLIEKNPDVSIFCQALKLTHLDDSIAKIEDKSYHPIHEFKNPPNRFVILNPEKRRYGYTALIENNALLRTYGINNLTDLIEKAKQLYPSNSAYEFEYTNPLNSLNQYIAYHLVNKAIYYNKFFYTRDAVKGFTPDEFIETMLANKIIRTSRINSEVVLNPSSDYTTIVKNGSSKTTINGVYHLLSKLLVYSDHVERMLQNNRIRFDIVSLFPEMTNNNIRASSKVMTVNNFAGDLYGFELGYLEYLKMSKDTRLIYLAGLEGQWSNFQADELMGVGSYDITMRLLPVPPGTYELRFGYSANSNRSVTQVYIDNKPIGIPLDLRIQANDPKIGYIADNVTDDNGFENDKTMHNRGYMKAPTTFNTTGGIIARNNPTALRRIIGTFTFNDYKAHTLRFKSVLNDQSKQCMMDYFEYVPKSIYSPATGEPETRE